VRKRRLPRVEEASFRGGTKKFGASAPAELETVRRDFRRAVGSSLSHHHQLRPRQEAALRRFSAFNQRTTPELKGSVNWVSADISEDERTGLSYYTVRIAVSDLELAQLKDLKIVPGMPVEAFIQTGARTALSYFLKPLTIR
jgi:multidrug efflux pump subunit AcrA (membrane-fusion protein)